MRMGIGLPAAARATDMTLVGRSAAEAEHAGFESVGVDRLIYDNLDPLTALAAAAASTTRSGLTSTLVHPGMRPEVAPLFGLALLREGTAAVKRAWSEAGRNGRPWIVTGRYFSLGRDADATADQYIHHYYGADSIRAKAV